MNVLPVSETATWPLSVDLSPFDALLFDLDGTLVDTMPLHGEAYVATFAKLGYRLPLEDYFANVGPPARVAIAAFAAAAGVAKIDDHLIDTVHREKKQCFAEILRATRPVALATSRLLSDVDHGKPMAVVSSGNRAGVEAIIRRMDWTSSVRVIISGDDTSQGKPAPDPYLAAAAALAVPAARCLAFEDTDLGIASALAAGITVVDVTRPGTIHFAAANRER